MKRLALVSLVVLVGVLCAVGNGQEPDNRKKQPEPTERNVAAFEIPDLQVVHSDRGLAVKELNSKRTVYLGKKAKPKGRAMLQMQNYVGAAPLPDSLERSAKAMNSIRNVYGNDREGDCVIASGFHAEGLMSANDKDGKEIIGTTAEALNEYHRQGGPGDNGLVITEALDDWKRNGLLVGGTRRKLEAWGEFDTSKPDQVKTVAILFGGRVGFNVPSEWMNNAREGAVWDLPVRYSFVGGHDMRMIDYNSKGVRFATWGLIVTVTWRALADRRIFDEAYFELLPDWYGADGISGAGIPVARMRKDVEAIKNGQLPNWQPDAPDPPTPPVPPTPPATGDVVTLTVNGAAVVLDFKNKRITPPFGWSVDGAAPVNPVSATEALKAELTAKGIDPETIAAFLRLLAAILEAKKEPAPVTLQLMNWDQPVEVQVPRSMVRPFAPRRPLRDRLFRR